MIDPACSASKSSPNYFLRTVVYFLIAVLIVFLCLACLYFLYQTEVQDTNKTNASDNPPNLITDNANTPISLVSPTIKKIITENTEVNQEQKYRIELTDEAIESLSKDKEAIPPLSSNQ